ncbi:MAG: hypothetical protein HPY89_06540 [Pelotomaculum sp.]|nr:hypothetical protein [Pelotomaculum sp.]
MARINWSNVLIKILSLLLALALWVYVSNEQNPVREKILTVSLERTGPAQNFVITGDLPESVKVRVQGTRSQLANLSAADLKAVINIPERETGDLSLPVQVSAPAGLRVVQVTPDEVRVSVDRMTEKSVAVAVSLRGAPAQGFTALAPVCQPGAVTARGPSRVINEISQATAVVDIQAATKDVEQNVPVSVGNLDVTLIPSAVRVTVPVVSALASKTVPVLPQVTGSPAAGYALRRSYAEPESVQIFGAAEVLGAISNIRTEPVDVQGVDGSLSRETGLVVPHGVANVYPAKVKVQVEIEKVEAPPQQQPGSRETS